MDMKESLGPAAVFPLGEENEAYAQYFVGKSYLAPLTGADAGVGVSNVTFEPGCRNHWHVHHAGGQILLVTGGRGYYQEWGRPARELEPGDVVSIPPETKHWHGAAPDSWSPCRPKARRTSGWSPSRTRTTPRWRRRGSRLAAPAASARPVRFAQRCGGGGG